MKHVGKFEKLNLSSENQMDQDERTREDEKYENIERPAQCEFLLFLQYYSLLL